MSQEYDQHMILHHLDDPLRLLKWTVDEMAVLLGPLFFGFALEQLMMGVGVSAAGYWGVRSLKKKYGISAVKHALYWYLPKSKKKLPNAPPSYIREYIG